MPDFSKKDDCRHSDDDVKILKWVNSPYASMRIVKPWLRASTPSGNRTFSPTATYSLLF
jgi:hypothetical protein